MNRESELVSQGWVRQFTADEPRLSEAVEEYRELGFEVHLEPLDSLQMPERECSRCLGGLSHRYRIIYTRRPFVNHVSS